jgi:uncharacterized coiled-coil protein SlyX
MTNPQPGPDVPAASSRPKRTTRSRRPHLPAEGIDIATLTARMAEIEATLGHALKSIEELQHNQIRLKGSLDHLTFRVTDLYQQVLKAPASRH